MDVRPNFRREVPRGPGHGHEIVLPVAVHVSAHDRELRPGAEDRDGVRPAAEIFDQRQPGRRVHRDIRSAVRVPIPDSEMVGEQICPEVEIDPRAERTTTRIGKDAGVRHGIRRGSAVADRNQIEPAVPVQIGRRHPLHPRRGGVVGHVEGATPGLPHDDQSISGGGPDQIEFAVGIDVRGDEALQTRTAGRNVRLAERQGSADRRVGQENHLRRDADPECDVGLPIAGEIADRHADGSECGDRHIDRWHRETAGPVADEHAQQGRTEETVSDRDEVGLPVARDIPECEVGRGERRFEAALGERPVAVGEQEVDLSIGVIGPSEVGLAVAVQVDGQDVVRAGDRRANGCREGEWPASAERSTAESQIRPGLDRGGGDAERTSAEGEDRRRPGPAEVEYLPRRRTGERDQRTRTGDRNVVGRGRHRPAGPPVGVRPKAAGSAEPTHGRGRAILQVFDPEASGASVGRVRLLAEWAK